jgi:hypothetical protein
MATPWHCTFWYEYIWTLHDFVPRFAHIENPEKCNFIFINNIHENIKDPTDHDFVDARSSSQQCNLWLQRTQFVMTFHNSGETKNLFDLVIWEICKFDFVHADRSSIPTLCKIIIFSFSINVSTFQLGMKSLVILCVSENTGTNYTISSCTHVELL